MLDNLSKIVSFSFFITIVVLWIFNLKTLSSYEDARHEWVQVFCTLFFVTYDLFFNRYFNVNEVLDILENSGAFQSADIFIEPPPANELTDEDSGDED